MTEKKPSENINQQTGSHSETKNQKKRPGQAPHQSHSVKQTDSTSSRSHAQTAKQPHSAEKKHNSHNNNKQTSSAMDPKQRKAPVSKIALLALLLSCAVGGGVGGLYWHHQSQLSKQNETLSALKTTLTKLRQNTQSDVLNTIQQVQSQQDNRIASLNQTMQRQLTQSQTQTEALTKETRQSIKAQDAAIQALHEKISAMSTTDAQAWLISQADYLIKLAGRKIWQDNDFTTAQLLLKSADLSLAEMQDPSLLPIRQAIAQDIATLASVQHIDFDSIVLQLTQLANQVDALTFVEAKSDVDLVQLAGTSENGHAAVSESVWDWKQNLSRNWNQFLAKFITIKKRDRFEVCLKDNLDEATKQKCQALKGLIAPDQRIYVRENIRLQLLVATQAVARHSNEVYQSALSNVRNWVDVYFEPDHHVTQSFLTTLTALQKQSLSTDNMPKRFKSAPLLEQVMQTRVRSLMQQPSTTGE